MAEATVWLAEDSGVAALGPLEGWLSQSERARAKAFVLPTRRRQFVLGRVLARQALGALLDIPPQSIVLEDVTGGAPKLAAPAGSPAYFSISHSGHWIACAVAQGPVGLDIERRHVRRDFVASSAVAFPRQQAQAIAALAPEAQPAAFYRAWTALEAAIKLGEPTPFQHHIPHPELAICVCSRLAPTAVPSLRQLDVSDLR